MKYNNGLDIVWSDIQPKKSKTKNSRGKLRERGVWKKIGKRGISKLGRVYIE